MKPGKKNRTILLALFLCLPLIDLFFTLKTAWIEEISDLSVAMDQQFGFRGK